MSLIVRRLLLSTSPSITMSSPGRCPVFSTVKTASTEPPHSSRHLSIIRWLMSTVTDFCSSASSRMSSRRSTRNGSLVIVVPSPISCQDNSTVIAFHHNKLNYYGVSNRQHTYNKDARVPKAEMHNSKYTKMHSVTFNTLIGLNSTYSTCLAVTISNSI